MTDEQIDGRLRLAGEQWRAVGAAATAGTAAPPAPPAPPATALFDWHHTDALDTQAGRSRARRRYGLAASAAVVAAAIAVGSTAVVRSIGHQPTAGDNISAHPVGLRGTVWKVVGYDSARRDLTSSATLYLGLQSHMLVADDECTLIGASVGTGPSWIDVSSVVVRHRDCTDQRGVRLSGGLDILRGRATYRVTSGALTISRGGHAMHLVPAPGATPAPTLDVPTVIGATWALVSATDPAGRQLRVYKSPRLSIGVNGRLSTGDQCNTITGHAVGTGSQLAFSHMSSTRFPCASQVSGVVGVVAGVLSGTAQTSVVGGRLTISKARAGSLTYLWEPTDQSAMEPARLTGRAWSLALLRGVRPDVTATMFFTAGGSVSGSDGCSTLDGRLEIGFGTLTLRTRETLLAGCPSAARAQAKAIGGYLSVPDLIWSVRDGRLVLSDGGAQADALVLTTAPATTLAGQRWTLATSDSSTPGGSRSISGPIATGDIVLTFDGRGGWRLAERCGTEAGHVATGPATLRFSGRHLVEAHPCPAVPSVDQRAQRSFLEPIQRVLDGASSWSVADGRLTLSRAGAEVTFRS